MVTWSPLLTDNGYNTRIESKGGFFMQSGIMAVPPGEIRHRPRKRTRHIAHRRACLLQITMALASALIAASVWNHRSWGRTSIEYQAVELIYQNPELPNGCEITSLSMALTAAGCPADKLTLYQSYLPKADFSYVGDQRYGPNPEKWYAGNAAGLKGGWYCFEGPIIQTANSWLDDCGSTSSARSIAGLSQNELDRYVQDGIPLVVWVTLDYVQPQYSEFSWTLEDGTSYYPYSNLHCVVLASAENGQYQIADPLSGFSLVDKDAFWDSFSAMGRRAVVIE